MGEINKDTWQKNKFRGNVAEEIISFLINSCKGWECIKFGMEQHVDYLKKLIKNNNDTTSLRIRTMPDFVAVNKEKGTVLLLDVKYRSFVDSRKKGSAIYGMSYGKIKDYLENWKDCKLVFVQKVEPHFRFVDVSKIEWFKHFQGRKYRESDNVMFEQWEFYNVREDIRKLFPEISDELYNTAVGMIPKD